MAASELRYAGGWYHTEITFYIVIIKFSEIEEIVNGGEPVYLTKNGYGTMVVMSLERYANLTDFVETKLDEADRIAETSEERYSHERVFGDVRKAVDGNEDL